MCTAIAAAAATNVAVRKKDSAVRSTGREKTKNETSIPNSGSLTPNGDRKNHRRIVRHSAERLTPPKRPTAAGMPIISTLRNGSMLRRYRSRLRSSGVIAGVVRRPRYATARAAYVSSPMTTRPTRNSRPRASHSRYSTFSKSRCWYHMISVHTREAAAMSMPSTARTASVGPRALFFCGPPGRDGPEPEGRGCGAGRGNGGTVTKAPLLPRER